MQFLDFIGNEALKARLNGQLSGRGLSHAYILSGPTGVGKHTLARSLAAAFLCEANGSRPCFHCTHCRKVWEGIHPDIIQVGAKGDVSVKQVRALRSDAYIQPNEGRRKIYIFENAQKLNLSSQNVLLKLLEEGPDYAAFLFLTNDLAAILQTVRSRCECLTLSPVTLPQAEEYLIQRFPDKTPAGIHEAAKACEGILGTALARLTSEESQSSKAQRSAEELFAALSTKQELELCECAVHLEKCSREELLEFLGQAKRMLQDRLLQLANQETGGSSLKAEGTLSKAQLLDIMQILHQLRLRCEANVSVGHCTGFLAAACWEVIG